MFRDGNPKILTIVLIASKIFLPSGLRTTVSGLSFFAAWREEHFRTYSILLFGGIVAKCDGVTEEEIGILAIVSH